MANHYLCRLILRFRGCPISLRRAYYYACQMDVAAAGRGTQSAACEVLNALNEKCPNNDGSWGRICNPRTGRKASMSAGDGNERKTKGKKGKSKKKRGKGQKRGKSDRGLRKQQ